MKHIRFLVIAVLLAGSFISTDSQAQTHPYKVVFMAPPPQVQFALEIYLETSPLALQNGLYHTGYFMNMSGYYHTGYNKTEFCPVMFQAVCKAANGNYWFVSFDSMGNFLFAMEGSNVLPD